MKLVWYVSSYTGMQASNQIKPEFVVFLTLNDTKMLGTTKYSTKV